MKLFKTLVATVAVAIAFCQGANAQILYKVEKAGSDKVSYLLGTHHFAPLSVIDSISEMPEILKNIDRLYGELDMSAMSDPSVMMGMQQKMMAPADSTLDKIYTAAQLDTIQAMLDRYTGGMLPLSQLYMLKPATISTQLAALMATKVFPELNPMEGIDATMQTRARQIGKPVAGLETLDFQIDMLYNLPISEQAKSLIEMARKPEKEEEQAVTLSKAYLSHNIDKILELMLEAEDEDPEQSERMIYSRNDNWVKQLTAEMPGESLMVVVGAGHLPGPRGVIEGLRKAGYTVIAVK